MVYKQLSDAELVGWFLSHNSDRTAIRDVLFGRYYERFDQRIRAVLYTYGLPYSPGEFYYNEIFMNIYQQVFELDEFETILQKYELERGKFSSWFLNYVVVNRVKNWLMKMNKNRGRKNIEWLKENVGEEYRQLSLNGSLEIERDELTLVNVVPAQAETLDEKCQQAIDSAINHLSPAQQLILRLLFMAYQEIPAQDVAYLANELNMPVSAIEKTLEQASRELRNTHKYEQSEKMESSLGCLACQEDNLRWKLKNIESELEALFPDKEMPKVEADSQLLFKDIELARQELDNSYKHRQIEIEEYHRRSLLLQYQYVTKQLLKISQKRIQLVREYQSGKYLVSPSYKQMAQLLNLSEGTVASRINRTVNRLKNLLGIEEKDQNICIDKVEISYMKEERYV